METKNFEFSYKGEDENQYLEFQRL